MVNQLSAEYSFRTNCNSMSAVHISDSDTVSFTINAESKESDGSVNVQFGMPIMEPCRELHIKIMYTSECNRGPQTRLEVKLTIN
jgi:hypothetical protein